MALPLHEAPQDLLFLDPPGEQALRSREHEERILMPSVRRQQQLLRQTPPPRNAWRALSLGLLPSILLGRHTTPTPMQGGETSLKAKLITTEIQADKSHCRGTWVKKADPGFTGQDRSHCTWVIGQRIKNPSWIIAEQRLCQLFARAMHSQCPLIPGQALQRGKSLFHWLDAESWKERRTSGHFYLFSGSF